MNEEQQWDVERYVLGDETLDRDAFEARMLVDERLAEAVSEAVEKMLLVRESWDARPLPVSVIAKAELGASVWVKILLATAASVFVVFLVRNIERTPIGSEVAVDAGPDALSAMAEQWLAIQIENEIVDESFLQSVSYEVEPIAIPSSTAEEGDWMLEAAQEFFQQMET